MKIFGARRIRYTGTGQDRIGCGFGEVKRCLAIDLMAHLGGVGSIIAAHTEYLPNRIGRLFPLHRNAWTDLKRKKEDGHDVPPFGLSQRLLQIAKSCLQSCAGLRDPVALCGEVEPLKRFPSGPEPRAG